MDDVTAGRLRLSYLLLLALAVRATLFVGGARGSDAYAYAQHAFNLATGEYNVTADTMYYGFRFAVLLPTALAYRIFGVHDWSTALFPVMASLVTLYLIVRIGSILFDSRTGLFGGLLYVFFPLDLPASSLLGPDSFIPMLCAAAVLAYLQAGAAGTTARRTALMLASGFCIGVATQARATSLLFIGSLLCLGFYQRRKDPLLWALVPGCLAPLLIEATYYWIQTGDPLYRLTVVQDINQLIDGPDPDAHAPTSWAYYPKAMLGFDLGGLAWFGSFIYGALGALVLAAWRKELPRLMPLLLLAVPPFLYLEFGSLSLVRYISIPKNYHYLSLISVPIVLMCAYGIGTLWSLASQQGHAIAWKKASIVVLLSALAITSVYGSYRLWVNWQDDARPYVVVASRVRAHPEYPIYVPHFRWALFLNYHLEYRTGFNFYSAAGKNGSGRLRYLHDLGDQTALPAAYVILHKRYLHFDTVGRPVDRTSELPNYVYNPPKSWRVLIRERAEPAYNSFTLFKTQPGWSLSGSRQAGLEPHVLTSRPSR